MTSNAAADLERILNKEREALLSGDFAKFRNLGGHKEELLRKLQFAPDDVDNARLLSRNIERNQRVILAAINGIKSAGESLTGSITQQKKTSVYTKGGARAVVQSASWPNKRKF